MNTKQISEFRMGSLSLEIIIKLINIVYFKDIGWLAIIQTVWETKTLFTSYFICKRAEL